MKLLVTGGAGFIGSNFCHLMSKQYDLIVVDSMTIGSDYDNLRCVDCHVYIEDICNYSPLAKIIDEERPDVIVNFAAESFVDRSIDDPDTCFNSNIKGTWTLLSLVKRFKIKKFVQISTDEVLGSLPLDSNKKWTEEECLNPRSPYSASKASAELICRSMFTTYDIPVVITRSSNNYGPRQYREKLLPTIIINALNNQKIPIYGNGLNIRDWLYVDDNCRAIQRVMEKGKLGEIYNIGGGYELSNIEMTKKILNYLGKPHSLIKYIKDRPGHDLKYSLDTTKIEKLGHKNKINFDKGLHLTIEWYRENTEKENDK